MVTSGSNQGVPHDVGGGRGRWFQLDKGSRRGIAEEPYDPFYPPFGGPGESCLPNEKHHGDGEKDGCEDNMTMAAAGNITRKRGRPTRQRNSPKLSGDEPPRGRRESRVKICESEKEIPENRGTSNPSQQKVRATQWVDFSMLTGQEEGGPLLLTRQEQWFPNKEA